MSEAKAFDPHRMFKHACAFADCAEYCEMEPNNIKYRTEFHTVSGIVNSAFACEIFIKTLLVLHDVEGKEIRGHDLKSLWSQFKSENSEFALSIENGLQAWFNSENEKIFDELLDKCSNAFKEWRYIYEAYEASININFLRGFRIILRNTCCVKLYGKTWDEYKNNNYNAL